MAWFLKLEKDGKDLYPLLKANFEKPGYYATRRCAERSCGISATS